MKTLQARIGLVFFIFSSVLYVSKIMYCLIGSQPWNSLIDIDRLLYLSYPVLFFITIPWESTWSKILQSCIVLIEALFSLSQDPQTPFFGLSMIIIAFLLIYKYGFIAKNTKLKIGIIFISLYLLLVFIPLYNQKDKFLYGAEWLLFISFFLFTVWFIFSDSIKKLKEKESATKERYMKIIDEATSVAREAIELCEKEKQNLDERV
jgi:hypothetical protein